MKKESTGIKGFACETCFTGFCGYFYYIYAGPAGFGVDSLMM